MDVLIWSLLEIYALEGLTRGEEEEHKGLFVQCHKL
jgi:hypothetical protein